MIPAFVRARVHTLFAIALGTLPALAQSSDRDWNQARGNSAGTARTEFAPVRVTPVPVWKQPLGVLACEPVAWAGVVYAIATDAKGARKLHAFDVTTGLPVAKAAPLPAKGALHAAVWQGTVVVTSPEAVVFYSARGDQLAPRERKLTGDFPSAPTIHAGLAYVCGLKPGTTEPTIEVADIAQQKWLQSLGPGAGHAAVIDGKLPGSAELRAAVFQVEPGSKQKQFGFTQASVSGLGTKSVQFGAWTLEMFTLTDPPAATGPGFEEAYVAYIRPREHESGGEWFVYTPGPFQASDGTKLHTLIAPRALSPIVTPAALVDGRVFGFSASGELIRFDKDGKYVLVVPKSEKLPAGARPGPATVAQDVLYLGNWAVELPAGRVLWCDPALAATTPLQAQASRLEVTRRKAKRPRRRSTVIMRSIPSSFVGGTTRCTPVPVQACGGCLPLCWRRRERDRRNRRRRRAQFCAYGREAAMAAEPHVAPNGQVSAGAAPRRSPAGGLSRVGTVLQPRPCAAATIYWMRPFFSA